MSGRKVLWYLMVLLLAAGGYFLSEFYQSRREVQEQAAKKIFDVKTADIGSLALKSDKGEIILQPIPATEKPAAEGKKSDTTVSPPARQWRLVKPIVAKADDPIVNSMLDTLAELKMQRQFEPTSAENLKDFGLEKPILIIEFRVGDQKHQLRFGIKVPGNRSYYAQKDQDPKLLLINAADKEALDRTLTALRRKTIFSLKPDAVHEIRLINGRQKLVLQKKGPSEWIPSGQPQTRLRADRIDSFLRSLSLAQAAEFVAEKADDPKKYGLSPRSAIHLTLVGPDREETLLLGGKQGERFYAQKQDSPTIFLVDKSLAEKFPASYEALQDRRLWSGKDDEVQKIAWGPPDKPATATREQDAWKIQLPDNPPHQQTTVKFGLALWRLKEIEYDRLLAPRQAKPSPPVFTLTLVGAEGKPLFRLEELKPEKDLIRVSFSQGQETQTALVPAKSLDDLKQDLDRLSRPVVQDQKQSQEGK
ncbi:DUF4340 domain-containing protein [Desulfobacca acetoxidans]